MYQEKLPRLQSRTPRPLLRRHVIVLSIHYAINATLYTLKVRASERESNSLELLQRAQPKLNNKVVNPQPAACCPVFVNVNVIVHAKRVFIHPENNFIHY